MNNHKKIIISLAVVSSLLVSGCSFNETKKFEDPKVDLSKEIEESTKNLLKQLNLNSSRPMLGVSFADINCLNQSSPFGRVLGEQYSSALTSQNQKMLEIRLRDQLYIQEAQGEFILSRDLKRLVNENNAQAVLVGTYTKGGSNVYVTSRIIKIEDSSVLASDNLTIPLNKDIRDMLPKRRDQYCTKG